MKLKTLKFYKDIFITSLASLVSAHAANAGEVKVNPLSLDGQEASNLLMGCGEPSSFNSRSKLTKPFILKDLTSYMQSTIAQKSSFSQFPSAVSFKAVKMEFSFFARFGC